MNLTDRVGLYLGVIFVNADERLVAQGLSNVRLSVFVNVNAEAARASALELAFTTYPPEQGFTGHDVYLETAPLDFLREVLPHVTEIEPYAPMPEIQTAPREEVEAAERDGGWLM